MANNDPQKTDENKGEDASKMKLSIPFSKTKENDSDVELTGRIRLWETIPLAIGVLMLTVLFTWLFYVQFNKLESFHINEAVVWNNPDSLTLNTAPNWLFYNPNTDSLSTSKVITTELKLQLLGLTSPIQRGYDNYKLAVDELAFKTNQSGTPPYDLILLVAGLAATIGVQIRTLFDFVGRACYKKDLKLKIWWPWYVLRPPMGFLLGAVVIVLFDGKFFNPAEEHEYSHAFLLGLTVLAGFGATDVADLLRNLSKKIFAQNRERDGKAH